MSFTWEKSLGKTPTTITLTQTYYIKENHHKESEISLLYHSVFQAIVKLLCCLCYVIVLYKHCNLLIIDDFIDSPTIAAIAEWHLTK